MKKTRKVLAIVLALAMVLGMSSMAFAANADPNMTVYNTAYTTTFTEGTGSYVELMAGPADSGWSFTGFADSRGAQNVTWSVVDGSTSGVTISAPTAEQSTSGQWYTKVTATVADNAASGSASIKVVNKATDAYVNFTIIVNPATAETGDASVQFEIYNGADTAISTGNGNVNVNGKYTDRNFITVADSMITMLTSGVVSNYSDSYGYVTSLTVGDGPAITPDYPSGWQYRIYRDADGDGTYNVVGITEYLGYDDVKLQSGDVVQWRTGTYEETDPPLFPASIER